jgi:hypothetical protein
MPLRSPQRFKVITEGLLVRVILEQPRHDMELVEVPDHSWGDVKQELLWFAPLVRE